MTNPSPNQIREADSQGFQLANLREGGDPGNTDPEKLTTALDPDDDVYHRIDDTRRQLDQPHDQ